MPGVIQLLNIQDEEKLHVHAPPAGRILRWKPIHEIQWHSSKRSPEQPPLGRVETAILERVAASLLFPLKPGKWVSIYEAACCSF